MYEELILNVKDYYIYRIKRGGEGTTFLQRCKRVLKYLFSITSSGYPRVLSLGVCMHDIHTIVICKIFNWQLRLEHERGHVAGLGHTSKIGYVMNPWGVLRGTKYLESSYMDY